MPVAFAVNDAGTLTWSDTTVPMNENISHGTLTVSDNCCNNTYWWPSYWVPYTCQDKTGTAFRIAQKLMEKKIVNIKGDVEKFVKLVNMIAESL